jgi:SOS-response transcriptional repressor LexA
MKTLTGRQSDIVRCVWECLQETRYLTVADLVQRMNLAGESSLAPTLDSIERKGYLTIHRRGQGQSRLIDLTHKGIAEAQGVGMWPGLPVLGTIPAGPLTEAVEADVLDYIQPGNALNWKPGDFFLQVDRQNGDSMRGVGIVPGAYVLLRPESDIPSGKIVAAQIWTPDWSSCEGTLKRARFQAGQPMMTLEAENPDYEPMHVAAASVTFAGRYYGCLLRED